MKYVNQLQYPHLLYVTRTNPEVEGHERGKTTTIRQAGCGMCAAVMVADRLLPNCTFELEDAISLSYEVEANHRRGTDYDRFGPAFAKKLGLRYQGSNDVEDLRKCLRTGGAAVVLVVAQEPATGLFTKGGHFITVISEEPDGRFAILDPSLKDGKYDEEHRKGKVEITHDVVILCDGAVLDAEIAKHRIGYHLFWRA